ncbi:MAG: purine-binding chemotaxis protein CheW [Phycisphaerae bacterium]|nr:purine-binding chemotaxis protein CheW [Phycisphaerae bacterium]
MTEQATLTSEEVQTRAGKYLTFALAGEEYGLEILKVREIIHIMDITAVPQTPDYVKGVINLRGKVIPVVDLRIKVGMPEAERTNQTCIIVVDIGDVETGIIVDKVSEVMNILAEDIEDAPSFGANVNTDYILGIGKADEKVTILLDISKLLSQSDLSVATVPPVESKPSVEATAEAEAESHQEEHQEEPQRESDEHQEESEHEAHEAQTEQGT